MSHQRLSIKGGTLQRTKEGTRYEGTDGSYILFRGVRCHVSKWLARPLTAYQFYGHIVIGRRWARSSFDVQLLAHEYGHYLQQRELGLWKYLWRIALPSVFSVLRNARQHFTKDFERDASRRGRDYLRAELRHRS